MAGIVNVSQKPQVAAEKPLTAEQVEALFIGIHKATLALTVRTRKDFVDIARNAKKWGRAQALPLTKSKEICEALETQYALRRLKLDIRLVQKSFRVLPEIKQAEALGKVKEYFACANDGEVKALLGAEVESDDEKTTSTPLQRFGKFVEKTAKSNDLATLENMRQLLNKAIAALNKKRRGVSSADTVAEVVENGAVVAPVTEKPAEVAEVATK